MEKIKSYSLMVFATLLFAGAFVAGKVSAASFTPVMTTFLRIGLASLVLFPYMVLKEGKRWRPSKGELILALQMGIIGMTFYHLFFFTALKYTSVTNASVINGSMPVITALLAWVFLKEKLTARKIFYILLAFLGVVLTITNWKLSVIVNMTFNKGDLLMLCGTLSWASYGILIKKYSGDSSPIKLMAYALVVCSLVVAPFALREIVLYNPLAVPLDNYYSIIYMALLPTVVGYTIQQKAIRDLGPSTAALFINLVPVFSIILSVIILDEKVKPLTYVSGSIIIFAVYAYTKNRQNQAGYVRK